MLLCPACSQPLSKGFVPSAFCSHPPPELIYERLAYERLKRGFSFEKAAREIGVNYTTLFRMERRELGQRHATDLVKVLDYYGLSLELLRTIED